MALKYITVKMKNPIAKDEPEKYYPRIISTSQETISTLAKAISQDCTPNEEDCLIVVDGIMKQIVNGLTEGNIVKIDRLGTFRTTIVNDGSACPTITNYLKDPAKFNAKSAIQGVHVIFTPCKELRTAISQAPAEKYIPEDENPSIKKAKEEAAGGTVTDGNE